MFIDRDLKKYVIFSEDSILNALKKISENKSRIIFSVTESGILEGILTDGDFRRWLTSQKTFHLDIPVHSISNKNYKYVNEGDDTDKIRALFSSQIEFVPILDHNKRLVAIARNRPGVVQIEKFIIHEHSPAFIIAEIGNNHNGDIQLAKQLVDLAIEAGADCVKFQLRCMKSLYRNSGNANDAEEDLGSQYTLDLLSRFQLSTEEMLEVFDYCKRRGILALCTPWDIDSLSILCEYGMPAYKVASADLTNHDLLKAIANTGKPLICSTGMSSEAEIKEACDLLQRLGAQYILLHCNSTYPTPFKDINLSYLSRLKKLGDCIVGYSGHERDIYVAVAAVALGAKVIEKHFTIDKSMEGNDHKVSLLPYEFKEMVKGIRQIEEAIGNSEERKISQGEMINREVLAKSLIINCDLDAGQEITESMISIKSPGKGLQPNRKHELIGKKAKRNFKAGDFFFLSDLFEPSFLPKQYSFNRPWGIPVRYHDFAALSSKTNLNLVEFHLSYKDLDLCIRDFITGEYSLDFVVHSPELFAGDHIMDLCTPDDRYREHSIRELQRVVEVTKQLKPFFRHSAKPLIVVNAGGFSFDGQISLAERDVRYKILAESLSLVNLEEVEIILQTMPPFPWHFGGQRFHNLFVSYQDIARFCETYGFRVCFDVSHSKLACNYYRWSFDNFIKHVAPYAAHYHIADAAGTDGEGLQIGSGEIDFLRLFQLMNQYSPAASFIPEIWQGHKNGGEGFWQALSSLESILSSL